jgi:pimeloyl-ACP methyl ester carboxylesterase
MFRVPNVLFRGEKMETTPIEFMSEVSRVRGKFFRAAGTTSAPTLLLVPGWPGTPDDVLGLGALLPELGINVCVFNPRGLHQSEGTSTHANTLQDIAAALRWLRQSDTKRRFALGTARLALGGWSYGGGMAMAYAARDPSVRRLVSIAANDHAEFARELKRTPAFAQGIRRMLRSTQAPEGPARFDVEASLKELIEHQDVYGLRENASKLADRSILLIGGWEDQQATIDQYQLPLYRALKSAGAEKVTFLVYHTDHAFAHVRRRLASDIADWLLTVR